jgi:hypothetical protein
MVAELGSRVDDVITLQPLGPDGMAAIMQQQLQHAVAQAAAQGVALHVEPAAAAWLAAAGCSRRAGARPLGQYIRRFVLSPLAAALMDGTGVAAAHAAAAAAAAPAAGDGGGGAGAAGGEAGGVAAAVAAARATPGMWAAAVLGMQEAGAAGGGHFLPRLQLLRV